MNKREVLVIGRNGQLGHSIFDHVGVFKHPDANIRWTFTTRDELDITNEKSFTKFFKNKSFDYVINCAAYTDVAGAETYSGFVHASATNIYGVMMLGKWCAEHNTKCIHISTDYVYDGKSMSLKNEDSKLSPMNFYAITKLGSEIKFRSIHKPGLMILRISTLYSEYGKNIIKTFIDMLNKGVSFNAIDDNMFNITNATEMARFIVDDIIVPDKFVPGTYNYGNAGWTTTYELATNIAEIIGADKSLIRPIKMKDYESPVNRPQFTAMDFSKIENEYGVMKNYKDELTRFVKYYNTLKTK